MDDRYMSHAAAQRLKKIKNLKLFTRWYTINKKSPLKVKKH